MIVHLVLALSMAGCTWLLGWWGVAVVAVIAGVLYRYDGGRAWRVALAATEGWALLLVVDALGGPLGHVTTTLGGAMSIPGPALLLVTLLFPALIGWSGAAAASELSRALDGKRHTLTSPR